MRRRHQKHQQGYVLLLMVIILMGLGGVVAASFTQDVKKRADRERYQHNERILREAKQALLQYAYNYPQFNLEGPGRLPCPDTNNNGEPGAGAGIDLPICTSVGRFPWNLPEMNFYDARDASNERLWYAVSDSFYNLGGGGVVNSATLGSITIQDRSGAVLRDATIGEGVAAVIFAPGPQIDRAGVFQDRAADPNDPVNYLDLFGLVDNADFVNDTNNGFIVGPIENIDNGIVLVNDQMIVITAEEVIAAAEKATLQAYREALREYSTRIATDVAAPPAPWTRYYPWLYNYDVDDLDDYPSDPNFATERVDELDNVGRVPSTYTNYFTESASQPIESELSFDITLTYPAPLSPVGYDQIIPAPATGTWVFNSAPQHELDDTTQPQTIVFSNLNGDADGETRLEATAINNQIFSMDLWFWDEAELGPPTGVWTLCPAGGDEESDCHRDSVGNPTPGSPSNEGGIEALRVIAEIDFSGTVDIDLDFSTAPVITATSSADAVSHATIEVEVAGGDVLALPVTLRYEIDRYFEASFDIQESGTVVVNDLILGNLRLGLRYYPELPGWVFSNRWHEAVQMAYAADYLPNNIGAPADCTPGPAGDCLWVQNMPGGLANVNDNKIMLFTIAGEHDWNDEGGDGFLDDIGDVFELENDDTDDVFDFRAANSNDKILVIDEL